MNNFDTFKKLPKNGGRRCGDGRSVTRWQDHFSIFDLYNHHNLVNTYHKNCQSRFKCCQILKNPQNYAQDLKLCPSGKISPKLVTLAGRPPQRERHESEYWYDQTGLALNHSQDTHLLYKGEVSLCSPPPVWLVLVCNVNIINISTCLEKLPVCGQGLVFAFDSVRHIIREMSYPPIYYRLVLKFDNISLYLSEPDVTLSLLCLFQWLKRCRKKRKE